MLHVRYGQYRLCPKGSPLTEACFQRTPLPFAGSTHTIRFDNGTDVTIPATRVSKGTVPEGSAWARVPIPACGDDTGQARAVVLRGTFVRIGALPTVLLTLASTHQPPPTSLHPLVFVCTLFV
eukprot:gene9939-biopygen5100